MLLVRSWIEETGQKKCKQVTVITFFHHGRSSGAAMYVMPRRNPRNIRNHRRRQRTFTKRGEQSACMHQIMLLPPRVPHTLGMPIPPPPPLRLQWSNGNANANTSFHREFHYKLVLCGRDENTTPPEGIDHFPFRYAVSNWASLPHPTGGGGDRDGGLRERGTKCNVNAAISRASIYAVA